MDTDLWEIQAKAAEDSVPPSSPADDNSKPDTIALMLQSLLEERFQLRLRHEMRDFPVYLLTVGKGGSKLKLSEDQSDLPRSPKAFLSSSDAGLFAEPTMAGLPMRCGCAPLSPLSRSRLAVLFSTRLDSKACLISS